MKIVFVTVMPSPYTQDLFAWMLDDCRIQPVVFYLEKKAPDTHWGDSSLPGYAEVLPGRWMNVLGGRVHMNPGALQHVLRSEPDAVVIGGYSSLTSQRLMKGLSRAGTPWVFWGESPGMRPRGMVRRLLRGMAMRPVGRQAAGVAAIGSVAQRAYLREVGGRCPVENIPYCCEMNTFSVAGRQRLATADVRFLYCGQIIHRKGVDVLIDAFVSLAETYSSTVLELVGTGPDERAMRERIPARLADRVKFHGFQPIASLPGYFGAADVFVLPSRHDGWGVVVNQAIAAGLPVICSSAVGAGADLVKEGRNGFIVPTDNVAALAAAMKSLIDDPAKRVMFGEASSELAKEWTPAKAVDRWYRLLLTVLSRRAEASSIR